MDCKSMLIRVEPDEIKGIYRLMVHIPGVMPDGEWAFIKTTVFQLQETGMAILAEAQKYWDDQVEQLNQHLNPAPKLSPKIQSQIDEILGGKDAA